MMRPSRGTKPNRFRIYLLVVMIIIICTVLTVKWNLSAFQVQLAQGALGNHGPETALRGSTDDMVTADIKKGSRTFFSLDNVRKSFVDSVQAANAELQTALNKSGATRASGTIVRGVMIYLPPNIGKFEREVKAMYLSIAVMRSKQPAHMKTDFIVFTPIENFGFPESIGCSREPRDSHDEDEKCVVLPHVPLVKRGNISEPLVDYGNYIDSMLILAEFQFGDQYDYLMRSDSDTFLTPGFADWSLPDDVAIATGKGGYGSTNANNHLKWIATNPLGLKDSGVLGIGSTWFGRAAVMVGASKLTIEIMRWLDSQEFSEYEKKHSGVDGWPNWHWPVILLYGGHIAINQIPSSKIITHKEGVMELDYSSAHVDPIPASVKHIHCWHTDAFFSKFKFEMGVYKGVDLTEHKEMTTAASYAGLVAISSDRLSVSELRDLISDKQAMKEQKWMRLTL
jgi:hypothetical protein